jgi:hypoxanthine phosphoribosyltransferase
MSQLKQTPSISLEQRHFISWSEFGRLSTKLYDAVWTLQLDAVIGIGRGGLVIASYLAHKLDVPLYSVFVRHTRSGPETVRIDDLGTLPQVTQGNVLLVDDWVIHGHAMDLVKSQLPSSVNFKTLAIIQHPNSVYPVNYVGTTASERVYFPYD